MATLEESLGNSSQINAGLRSGLDLLARGETVTFTKYLRVVSPFDGFVYWINATLMADPAVFTAIGLPEDVQVPVATITAQGSLHYAVNTEQVEDGNYARNRVTFTTATPVDDFEVIGSDIMYVGEHEGLRIAFTGRKNYFTAASIYHYYGDAVYPAFETQFVDTPAELDLAATVSNSLPVWLALAVGPTKPWEQPLFTPFPLYPSYLTPDNVQPPYGTVHIEPTGTLALASTPFLDDTYTHNQLAYDRVRLTFYGVKNNKILDFVDWVNTWSIYHDRTMGIMNMPIVRDDKRWQSEITALAQKKIIDYEVNYYQRRVNTLARQLILSAIVAFHPTA